MWRKELHDALGMSSWTLLFEWNIASDGISMSCGDIQQYDEEGIIG